MAVKIVYSVQVNDFNLSVEVVCPNCGLELEIFDSPAHEADRLCPSDTCEDLRFKIAATVQVFTGVKQDHGTCWNCDGRGWVGKELGKELDPHPLTSCPRCKGTGRNP